MFKDVPVTHWAHDLIARMLQKKAVGGYPDGTFRPDNLVTRAECLSLIEKAQEHEYGLNRELLPSVVQVTARLSDGRTCLGSGVVQDKDGYISTNCHVIMDGMDPSGSIMVYFDGIPQGYPAVVKYGDLSLDIAILKIQVDDPALLVPVTFPDKGVSLLDTIFCIGNPLGLTDTVSKGIVSCPSREINGRVWIQTDAAINPGNSGGGAFNIKGQFIGIPTFIYVWADEEMTCPVTNVGFIAPWYKVKDIYYKAVYKQHKDIVGTLDRKIVLPMYRT